MPSSTVKLVSGPGALPQTYSKWPVFSDLLRQILTKKTLVFAVGKTLCAICAVLSLAMLASTKAQTLDARISVVSTTSARIRIDLRLPSTTKALSFRNTYAGVLGLGERIETVEGIKDDGERVRLQRLAPGEFKSAEEFSRFDYEVNLVEPLRPADLSHVSSLNAERGLLMMADLLPQSMQSSGSNSALISVAVPSGWTVATNVDHQGSRFSTTDLENAVFLMSPSLREKRKGQSATDLSIITTGQWPFSESDATKIAGEILEEYSRVTRFQLKHNPVLMLIPYPGEVGPANWSAETRGNVVVLLLGGNAKRKSVLSRLGIVLSHEMFHLWVPNSLKLEGAYDWFFEGFTLYQALRMDVRLGLISFSDYLDTIAAVYDSYRASGDRDGLSLIEASERRWTTSASLVYSKGMLVAFIYDLSLQKLSGCRASFDMIYTELFQRAAAGQTNANETIISLLNERDGLQSFSKDYVESASKIEIESALSPYGIEVQREGSATRLVVAKDLTRAQRNLLGCLGYRR